MTMLNFEDSDDGGSFSESGARERVQPVSLFRTIMEVIEHRPVKLGDLQDHFGEYDARGLRRYLRNLCAARVLYVGRDRRYRCRGHDYG